MRPEERARRPGESREVSGRADPLQHDAAQTAHGIRRQQEISFTFTGVPHFMVSPVSQRITPSSYLAPVLTLNPAPHAGLCDVSGHPLHRQPAGPNGHRCQGPGRHQAGGSRHSRGERVFMNLPLVFPYQVIFTKREGETLLTVLLLHPHLHAAGVAADLLKEQEWPHRSLPVSGGGPRRRQPGEKRCNP